MAWVRSQACRTGRMIQKSCHCGMASEARTHGCLIRIKRLVSGIPCHASVTRIVSVSQCRMIGLQLEPQDALRLTLAERASHGLHVISK